MVRRLRAMVVMAVLSAGVSAAGKLEVTVADAGLGRLAWAGADFLKDGKPQVKRIVFEHETLDANQQNTYSFDKLDGANPKVSFDSAARRLTYGYPWGSVSFAYAPSPDRLGITATITNDSKLPIADFEIEPLSLSFPAPPAKPKQGRWIETLPDRLGVVESGPLASSRYPGAAKLLLCCETVIPLNFGLTAGGKSESLVVLKGGVMMMEPGAVFYHYLGLPRVEPGKSLAIAFSLRFAPAEPDAGREIVADVVEAYRKYHQPRMVWQDRRPIGTIFVGHGKGPENNPRNWFGRKDLDVRTAAGKAELSKLFMELADRCIKSLKNTNAQGMIVWDPEGSENPHPITYIGDPRMVKILAPEVEDIYPEFFKKFRDAGLRTGCCIRPTQVYLNDKKAWSHGTGSHGPERNPLGDDFSTIWPRGLPWWRFCPVVERMCRKIEYARRNWGCTIFYVDTNGVYRQSGEKQEFGWALLDSHVWRDIIRRYPNVLLIPELGTGAPAQWAYAAQYLQPPYSGARTPPEVCELLPGAFSVCQSVNLSPAEWDKRRGEFLEGIRHGDGMFFRGWFDDGYNAKIKQLYEQVYRAGAIAPPAPAK